MMKVTTNTTTAALPEHDRARLVALVEVGGEHRAARLLRVSRLAIMRAAAGFPVRFPTACAIREGLRTLRGDEAERS